MNTKPNASPEIPSGDLPGLNSSSPAVVLSPTRPAYWSVRRELWENRSIYIAPLAVAAVYAIGFLVSLLRLPRSLREMEAFDPVHQTHMLAQLYAHAAMLLMLTGFLVGIFYSLDALHGERRDRSILFWKSLPVSDLTTVLAKASVPFVILPLVVFTTTVILQIMMRFVSLAVAEVSGAGAPMLWARLPLLQMELVLLYGLVVIALWHAPLYAWLLLVSGWPRRAAFLWAVLPWIAISIFELVAFHHTYVGILLRDRIFGFAAHGFDLTDASGAPIDPHFIPLSQLAPGRFLSSPGLWLGLVFAVVSLAAAVRLRRYRGPL
jgi:ABC-2 type transport system permease protein